jgi:hypothetical protein
VLASFLQRERFATVGRSSSDASRIST